MFAPDYADIAEKVAKMATQHFAADKLELDQLGISLARIDRGQHRLIVGSYRGEEPMYPASVVKLFYLVRLANELHDGKLQLTPELDRAARDMIVESVNDATSLVLDTLTGTTSGPELGPSEMAAWSDKRNSVNRWYSDRGYSGINACQKTWNEGPYGRDRIFYGTKYENRNRLTPDACVKLMGQIALDRAVPYGGATDSLRSEWMKSFLKRLIPAEGGDNEQAVKFSGASLPKGSELWSKAGWTDSVRHDVAWFKLPDGREYIWAIFTKEHSKQEKLIPFIASELLKAVDSDR